MNEINSEASAGGRYKTNRWLPRIAAGSMGLMGGFTVNALTNDRLGYVLIGLFATCYAALWWRTERRLIAVRQDVERLEADKGALRDRYADARQRADEAEEKLHNAAQVPVYVTGDDREFVYVTDLYEALGLPVREVQH
jgi:hypothetical protein